MSSKIMLHQVCRYGTESQPIAQASMFGWVLSGYLDQKSPSTQATVPAHHQVPSAEPTLDDLVKSFWDSEQPEDQKPSQSSLEKEVEEHYSETTSYSPDTQTYQVTLPKSEAINSLGESKTQAYSRFISNEKSILRRGIYEDFQAVVQQYLDLGHAEPVPPEEEEPALSFYMPMHSVCKDSSTSTKLRVVFDGSAATSTGQSLNSSLLVGPQLQPTLGIILMKFRSYPVALSADITKMYRAIELTAKDKDLHRFLWRPTPDGPVRAYRMTRVTFGVSASPYLAIRTLQQTAVDHGEDYPSVTSHVKESFYVDDFLGGASTPSAATTLLDDMRTVLQHGNFNLCKWRSSSAKVLKHLPDHLIEPSLVKKETAAHSATHSKALGLEWDSSKDVMAPSICVSPAYQPTKRGIISDVSKSYDILGWIAPATLLMKLLFQQFWKKGQGWDDTASKEDIQLHLKWRTVLPLLCSKQLPRRYSSHPQTMLHQELHGFSDASLKAYGAVVYLRTVYSDRPPEIALVTAKTKVAKLKPSTVPRLELEGAVLLTKLLITCGATLHIAPEHWHAWTDSSIVLCWLSGLPSDWKIFVSNRVSFILDSTTPETWNHVPTEDNPADCASRGVMTKELLNHPLWWNGPSWLAEEPISIPPQPARGTLGLQESKSVHTLVPSSSVSSEVLKRSSNNFTILAISAWILRFCTRIKQGPPSSGQHSNRRTSILLSIGCSENPRRGHTLRREQLSSRDINFHPTALSELLTPTWMKRSYLRVGGRLDNSSLAHFKQHPIIMDSKDELVVKYVTHMHVTLCHCGPSLLLCHTGIRMHIVGARRLTRKICSQCITCRKKAPAPQPQLMGQLPAARVTPMTAFTHTGIDFAGPFCLKLGHTRRPVKIKAYVCVFICLTYKAVHLELVSDLTTPAFKACLQRFVSRRGKPHHIYSDNGANFLGARNDLLELQAFLKSQDQDSDIKHYLLSQHQVTWHTIPQRSPHFGGLWESAVRSMKKRIMGTTPLSFEELTTVLCQVEACLNSRPLLPMTSHNQDGLQSLTAGHFLLFNQPSSLQPDPRIPDNTSLLRKWNLCQAIVSQFWRRWTVEYLHSLQSRAKWQHEKPNLQVDDVVIVRPDSHFTCHWPLARIIATYPGEDGLVRVVSIKTSTGVYKRPVTKISLLFRQGSTQEATPLPPAGCSGMDLPPQQDTLLQWEDARSSSQPTEADLPCTTGWL